MPETGRTISHYRIIKKLGEGGMGAVYGAQDLRRGCPVAVKFISAKQVDSAAATRFFREARAASALNHPNIITIHDIGEIKTDRFIAMELVEGRTLHYMSPEQARGESAAAPSNIFSLGIVLYESATGRNHVGKDKLICHNITSS